MPQSNPDNIFQFRSSELAKYYDIEFGRDRRSLAAKLDLEKYRLLLFESKPSLTQEEAIKIYCSLDGCNTNHVDMLLILQRSVASEVAEQGEMELAMKIKDWLPCQWLAVVDACDRVGKSEYHIKNLASELKRVNLISED